MTLYIYKWNVNAYIFKIIIFMKNKIKTLLRKNLYKFILNSDMNGKVMAKL